VDIIADELVIRADLGVGPLQTSVQSLDVTTTAGSIELEDRDSATETAPDCDA
jgi:hypothetical protein